MFARRGSFAQKLTDHQLLVRKCVGDRDATSHQSRAVTDFSFAILARKAVWPVTPCKSRWDRLLLADPSMTREFRMAVDVGADLAGRNGRPHAAAERQSLAVEAAR